MAEEKWKRDLVEAAIASEWPTISVKHPPAAKYKKARSQDEDHPDIEVGKRFVARFNRGRDVGGYGQVVLLDYETVEKSAWFTRISFIGQVVAVTHEDLDDWVGRLIHVEGGESYWARSQWSLQTWDWRHNFKWRTPS